MSYYMICKANLGVFRLILVIKLTAKLVTVFILSLRVTYLRAGPQQRHPSEILVLIIALYIHLIVYLGLGPHFFNAACLSAKRVCLPFLTTLSISTDQLSFRSIMTPRYFA